MFQNIRNTYKVFATAFKKPAPVASPVPEPPKDVSYECIVNQILVDLRPENHDKWTDEVSQTVERRLTFCDGDRIYGIEADNPCPIEAWLTNTDMFKFERADAKRIRAAIESMLDYKEEKLNEHRVKADQRILAKIFPNCVK